MKNCIKIFAIVLLFSFNVLCLNGCIQNQIVDQIDNAVLLGNDFAGSSQIRYESSDDVAIGSSIYTYRQYSVDRLETIQKPDTKLYFIYQKNKLVGIKISTSNKDSFSYRDAKYSLYGICYELSVFPQEQVEKFLYGAKDNMKIGEYITKEISTEYDNNATFWLIHEDFKERLKEF